ncbi:hypothetical protein [Nonomuraea sediminis]|uniref:hypothetical protein n=1 Tax=Nonomuraea sediminis TaxID=2835864 RepID=UPI001BDBC1E7|nr:hypothetical protein [Nonomuraea sediminis]
MSLSDVIRNIAKTVTDKDELKEKAKDLPMFVVQTTLNAAGQALLLVDRVKNSIKGLAAKDEEEVHETELEAPEEKPARREPVIFAPRPSDAEPNGTAKAKPEPVIFSPAGKPAPAEETKPLVTETPAAPEPAAVATEPVVAEEPAPAATVVAEEPAPAAAVAAEEPAPAVAADEPAASVAEEPAVAVADEPKPAAKPKAAAKPRAARKPAAKKAPAVQEEPLPGYSELTVASLRARMRGKTAEQIKDFLSYEQATTARPEVIKMFENRLAKLEAGE